MIDQILKALAWQVRSEQWCKDGGQYIPNPATYLNQGRWQDEPAVGKQSMNSLERLEARNREIAERASARHSMEAHDGSY